MNKIGNPSFITKCNGSSQRFRSTIKNPTICPNCNTVYSHSNPIKECRFCNWKNKKYDSSIEEDGILNLD